MRPGSNVDLTHKHPYDLRRAEGGATDGSRQIITTEDSLRCHFERTIPRSFLILSKTNPIALITVTLGLALQ
jgi:hypothetical protein